MAKKTKPVNDDYAVQVALFGENGLAFSVDDTEDTGTLASHIAVLTKSTHAMTRILHAAEGETVVDADELILRLSEAKIGLEFMASMCASLADDLARRAGVHHG